MRTEAELKADIDNVLGGAHNEPTPQPLRRTLEPAEPFPLNALGNVLEPAARKIIEIIQCPDAVAGQSLAASAALAVQAHADIEIDGRVFPVSENFVTVAESGERKSATDRTGEYNVERKQTCERKSLF